MTAGSQLPSPPLAVVPVVTSWGEEQAIVERGTDGRWYAVLRDGPLLAGFWTRPVVAASRETALAALTDQCDRASRGYGRSA